MSSIFDEDYYIPELSKYSFVFPNPKDAGSEGLLAFGGGLEPNRILTAYRKGIFPWFNADDPVLWWSPDPRLLLYPKDFKVRKSFRKVLRNRNYIVKFDHNFEHTIKMCAKIREAEGTWLIKEMQEAYTQLHHMGFAHSIEVYEGDEFIGGLYGIAMGRAFFGESMVSLKPDASKIALKALSDVLEKKNYKFIDCQVPTPHLQSMGATLIEREVFLDELEEALWDGGDIGSWQHYKWEYNDG
ncbi:MAG TPA: leucyl/phenylalanyl-tRNA--protein transferase [Nitratifractor sp.]|nr:leucyl/phenylalanyl-tRNA--protein transferase [Nitratifractor sp.]HHH20480.1 leucyl/phenylalanyl-tRNA--protein transferase [Nitratifractor sp.]